MAESLPPLRFPADGEQAFHRDLKRAAHACLAGDHRYADAARLVKAALLLVLCAGFYALSLMQHQPWAFFLCYFLFVTMGMLLNVNVNHDASHNAFLRAPWANRLVGRVVTLPLGVDPDYWRTRHVDYHHVYANVEHYDLDTEENGFFRQTPFQRWRPHMRYQHLYWPLIAALSCPISPGFSIGPIGSIKRRCGKNACWRGAAVGRCSCCASSRIWRWCWWCR